MGIKTSKQELKESKTNPNLLKEQTHDINKILCFGDSMRYMKFSIGQMEWNVHDFSAN